MKAGRQQLAVTLMGISLVLLALFEIFWLDKEYQDQKDWLQHEQSEFFVSSIRSLEDSLFHAMVLTPLKVQLDSSLEFTSPRGSRVRFESADSSQFMTIVRSIDVNQPQNDDSKGRSNASSSRRYSHHRSMMLGALSMQLAEGKDSLVVIGDLTSMIQHKLLAREEQAPDVAYQLTTWVHEAEGDAPTNGLVSRPYYDAATKQHIALLYPEYNMFLLGRILPQILFAIFLFACISSAFYLIYKSLRKQQRLAIIKNDFISNITHELKTPISTVRVALEALQNFSADRDPEKSREYLEISQNELDRLALLVDKVLKMSNFEGEHAVLKIERFDLKELIQQILSTMKVQFSRLTAHVEFDTNGGDFEIEADRLHMTGVVYNLLDNALKYSPADPSIKLNLEQNNGNLTLEVTDQGQGISKEYASKIFEKFFRVPAGDQHDIKGHGLGLSYVAEVVAQHQGTIDVDSEVGKGSKFKLTFPRTHAN